MNKQIGIPKDRPERDKKYLKAINENGCIICEQPSTAHHICNYKISGTATKPSDYLTIPLCSRHHDQTSDKGIHKNVGLWERINGLQPQLIMDTLAISRSMKRISESMYLKYVEFCQELIKKRGY